MLLRLLLSYFEIMRLDVSGRDIAVLLTELLRETTEAYIFRFNPGELLALLLPFASFFWLAVRTVSYSLPPGLLFCYYY